MHIAVRMICCSHLYEGFSTNTPPNAPGQSNAVLLLSRAAGMPCMRDRLDFTTNFLIGPLFSVFHHNPTAARQGARLDLYASRDEAA